MALRRKPNSWSGNTLTNVSVKVILTIDRTRNELFRLIFLKMNNGIQYFLLPTPFAKFTYFIKWFCVFVWFLRLMAYQLFLGYLMPKLFSKKNSSGTI